MAGVNEIADKISQTLNLSISSGLALPPHLEKFAVTHSATSNAATWKEALAGNTNAPHGFLYTKTLVFKPKTAKDQATVLAMVVALEDTATSAKQVAAAVNAKDARFATADVVKETLGITVEQGILDNTTKLMVVSPLSISKETAGKIKVLIDSRLAASQNLLAFHPSDASKTVFITAQDLKEYLASCGVDVTEFDFAATAT